MLFIIKNIQKKEIIFKNEWNNVDIIYFIWNFKGSIKFGLKLILIYYEKHFFLFLNVNKERNITRLYLIFHKGKIKN